MCWVCILKYLKSAYKLHQYAICILGSLEEKMSQYLFLLYSVTFFQSNVSRESNGFGKTDFENLTFEKQSDAFGALSNLRVWLSSGQKQGEM